MAEAPFSKRMLLCARYTRPLKSDLRQAN